METEGVSAENNGTNETAEVPQEHHNIEEHNEAGAPAPDHEHDPEFHQHKRLSSSARRTMRSHQIEAANKKRRSSIIGNLMAEGRLSRGLSIQHILHHMTNEQREKKDEALPPQDYYLLEELDLMPIFLEKPEEVPGVVYSAFQQMASMSPSTTAPMEATPDGELPGDEYCPPPPPEEPMNPPEYAVFPVSRNMVELQCKLNVVRNLKTYLQHNNIDEGKCYYSEDEIDLSLMTSKPISFLILGKPGCGKTTLAMKLAEKLHAVHLTPENIIEYFRDSEPLTSVKVNETLENGESIGDGIVVELLEKRIKQFDILHRGYVLEGFPMVTSDDLPVDEQLDALKALVLPPQYLLIMQIQDKDLYKRRISQRFDPDSWKVYTEHQYSKYDPDEQVFNRSYRYSLQRKHMHTPDMDKSASSDAPNTEDLSDTEKRTEMMKSRTSTPDDSNMSPNDLDFPKLPEEVLQRLFYRTEDFNIIVNDDLESFRYSFQDQQQYVQNFDKRKILEIDAYWSPTVIFRRVWEFCEATGIQPVPVPVQIMRPLATLFYKKRDGAEDAGEDEEDDDDDDDDADDEAEEQEIEEDSEAACQDDDQQGETDWGSVIRAVAVRGLVDPRFRWRLSRWVNLCPVALKLGRSTPGKPELAVSFMDKVFFLSTKHAVDQFINNPRPYLLPKMPTSPIKFIVVGHPLAGKTTFAKELAGLTNAFVIDVNREVLRRFGAVKKDFIWKKRLKYVLEATNMINKENAQRWRRQERIRRRDMHAWIENHLKALAEAEIEAALDRDREMLHKLRVELRKASEYHGMGEPFPGDGICQSDDAKLHFNWQKFAQQAFGGKKSWTHQELLELAWDLFHQRRLYYKRKRRDSVEHTVFNDFSSDSDEEYGLISDVIGKRSPSGESSDESTSFNDAGDEDEDDGEADMDLDDDEDDDDVEEEETKKPKKRKRRNKKKKKKCRLEVKPVEPEDVVEPFLFETFDVDPSDPEVEESVRLRFPMIPFELVDIVPSPPMVGETEPMVHLIVEEKLSHDIAYVESLPPPIFVEILKNACTEVEAKHRKRNRRGPMSGGWIIENFPADIEKWRAVLRTPQICPDQAFLLLDLTEGSMTIWGRFKKLFKLLQPVKPESRGTSGKSPRVSTPQELPGEDPDYIKAIRSKKSKKSHGAPGEDMDPDQQSPSLAGTGDATNSTDNDTEQEDGGSNDVDTRSLELVSKSHFILSLLPRDDLLEMASMTSSEKELVERDVHRTRTAAFSDLESQDELEKVVEGHEKYILESIEHEFAESEGVSITSLDIDEYQRAREAALKFKSIYVEMTACLDDVDAFHQRNQALRTSSATDHPTGLIKNPPGTPETGLHSEPEEDLNVRMPLEIEKGEVELSPEEEQLRMLLEEDIRRLSLTDADDYIKTPTEMGSAMTLDGRISAEDGDNQPPTLLQRLLSAKIESPKRKFFAQVRMFNEFWNMALPVCNQQGVRYWEVGLCNEESAMEKAIYIWDELESRFDAKAKRILETELREEDEEITESFMKWGEPYEFTDMRFRSAKDKTSENESKDTSEMDDDSDDEDDSFPETSEAPGPQDKDELALLENQPLKYWKVLKRLEAERCFGDFKYYCPVMYKDFNVLRKGCQKYACKYKDRLYYCSDENNQLRFLVEPRKFLTSGGPPTPTPPRICITGSPGCLQEEIASQICNEFKVCYVNFRQRLHEIIKARFGREVGPEKTGHIVPKDQTRRYIENSKSTDDLTNIPERVAASLTDSELGVGVHFTSAPKENNDNMESEVDLDLAFTRPILPTASTVMLSVIESQEITLEQDQRLIQDSALKSLGLLSMTNIETVPLNSIERTERLTERKWQRLTRTETYIQGFLENGIQLPEDVLDEFIAPLWKEAPFNHVGFVLVGFPNTDADVQYMVKRNFFPEHAFVMECKSIAIRNRLIVPAVDRWHKEKNPSGKKRRKLTRRSQDVKEKLSRAAMGLHGKDNEHEIFQYQVQGRSDIDEFESETWTYNDALSRDIARALKYYHGIYSNGLERLKKSLNHERLSWTPVDTNTGLHQGKHQVLNAITSILKYRNNIFEDTVRLTFSAAQALLDRGVFSLSRLHRWCPVELSKGNTGVNIWNAPGVKKIPYLHRRFIYFVAGEKNAQHFEENTWELTNQSPPIPPVPLICMVLGRPKTGKTTLAKKISQKLGLLHVSALEAIESVVTHAFVTQWAQVVFEVNPALAAAGHQPMTLANEILEYIREGRPIPRFLIYRCLDLYLMNPKAQYHGVVFDDFPTIIDELIEVNYREMSPCVVLDMRVPIMEAYARCDANRDPELKNDQLPEEGRDTIDYMWDQYDHATMDTYRWFAEEYQNIHAVDGTQNPEMVYKDSAELCIKLQRKIQEYMSNMYYEKPNTLEGTCPITSTLFHRLNPDFGFFCPVALNDADELVSVREISDLSQVVEYKGQIYLFSTKNAVRKFMNNPKRYTVPGCLRTPPKDVPQTLMVTPQDFERLREHYGFMDFDPVLYYANHHYKGLQRGDPKYCVVYRGKLYVFVSEENQTQFMRKPSKYWNLLLPLKIPRKAEPINYDKVTPFSYLSAKGMIPILRRILKLMAEKRPRAPFMNIDQCAALYMGYYLKTQNMTSPFERRQKYRDAMFKMSTLKSSTREFLTELKQHYGCRTRNLPDRLRHKLEEFLKFEHLPLEDKVHIPKIPGLTLGYDVMKSPFNEPQVVRKVRRIMDRMKEVEIRENMDAFSGFTRRKKVAEESAARAAQDALEAAELSKKLEEKAQARLLMRSKSAAFHSGGGAKSGQSFALSSSFI